MLTGSVEYTKLNPMQNKTKEERQAIAAKSHAARRANKEARDKKRKDAEDRLHFLKNEIENLERIKDSMIRLRQVDDLSSRLTGKTLLCESSIVDAARQWVPLIGIYFLIKERKIIYIGQSNNILTRITTHSNSKDFDSYSYIPCDESILDKLESLYIHVYQPELNGFLTEGRKHAPIQLHELLGIAEGVSTIRNTISQTKWGK